MNHIYFIRGVTITNTVVCYEAKPNINVFGDKDGYCYFVDEIEKAKRSNENIHLKVDPSSCSMEVVILKPNDNVRVSKVKFSERFVKKNERVAMELVVYGTKSGYENLQKAIWKSCEKNVDGYHVHVDRYTRWLTKDSIEVVIDSPISEWNANNRDKEVRDYKKIPYSKAFSDTPSLDLFDESYVELVPDNIDFFNGLLLSIELSALANI